MQIKINGNKIQLVRTVYVPAERTDNGDLVKGTGRTKIGCRMTFDISRNGILSTEIPDEISVKRGVTENTRDFLTDEEFEDLEKWLVEKKAIERRTTVLERWSSFRDDLTSLADAIMIGEIDATESELEEFELLFRSLKEAVRDKPVFRKV